MEIKSDFQSQVKFNQLPPEEHFNMMIDILPAEKSNDLKSILKNLSESEKKALKTEMDNFKSVSNSLSPEERAEGLYWIIKKLFGDVFEFGDHLINTYV